MKEENAHETVVFKMRAVFFFFGILKHLRWSLGCAADIQ